MHFFIALSSKISRISGLPVKYRFHGFYEQNPGNQWLSGGTRSVTANPEPSCGLNAKARRKAGLFEHCYWLKHSRLGVTHLLSMGASRSRVVVGDFEFSTVLGA
jgi:hypothetical protein